ncbi:DotD/TraH family lipoprotein [Acetobacter persici]|uniref:Uncharacterized protein n=1 Tax=Acetobacter persici TaxID=1076596 RepID=A0A1U9LJF1_9PROT|nr:DotD/TraH family lipoprotein [Acetobacter persici]AQT06585.1 hypothetical protein A0U91_16385 [Acetobacter persici]
MVLYRQRFFSMCALVSGALTLSACGDHYESYRAPSPIDVPYSPEIREEADQMLAQAAMRVKDAQTKMAMVAAARTPPPASAIDESGLPPELQAKTTIDFTGPGVEVAKRLAESIGYGFIETGGDAKAPGIVTVQMQDMSVAKVLEDVGLQVQQYATLIVDPTQRRIEYRNESIRRSEQSSPAKISNQKSHPARAPKRVSKPAKKPVARFRDANCHCTKSASVSVGNLPAGFVSATGASE